MADTTSVTTGGLDPRPLPAAGWVRFRAVHRAALGLVAELGPGEIRTSGYAVRETIGRGPQAVALSTAGGRPPLRLELPLLLDRDGLRGSVEDEVRMLERLHGLDDGVAEAPALIVEGIGIPHSYSRAAHLRWTFDGDPEWGEIRAREGGDGARSYVEATVALVQLVGAAAVATPATPEQRLQHEVRKGGIRTLRTIARHYKVADWRTLLPLNPRLAADPDLPLKPGTKVRYR